jgi:hypothetical protein
LWQRLFLGHGLASRLRGLCERGSGSPFQRIAFCVWAGSTVMQESWGHRGSLHGKGAGIAICGNACSSDMALRVASGACVSAAAAVLSRKSYSLQCLKDDAHYPGRTSFRHSRLVDTNDPVATRCQGIMFATSIMVSQVISEPADKLAIALCSEECPITSLHKSCRPQFWSNLDL